VPARHSELRRGGRAYPPPARNASQREFPILRNSGVRIFPNPGTRRPDFGNRKPELGSVRERSELNSILS